MTADPAARENRQAITPIHAGAWVAPRPSELPDLRMQMCEQVLKRPHSHEFLMRLLGGSSPLIPTIAGPPEETAAIGVVGSLLMARSEQRRLRQAQLYWVDEDMTSLALAASATPSREPVRARRMPAESGLMLFAHPIGSHDVDLATALTGPWTTAAPDLDELWLTFPVVGVSWSRWSPADLDLDGAPGKIKWSPRTPEGAAPLTPEFDGIWLTFWTTGSKGWDSLPLDLPLAVDKHSGGTLTAVDLVAREAFAGFARLQTYDELVLRFDQPLPDPDPDNGSQWAHVVYTAWQLMGQTGNAQLTESETVPRPRHGHRRDKRANIVGPGAVQLVRVHTRHRPSAQASAEDTAASHGRRAPQWTRRWPVRPYRRNTCLNPRAHAEGGCEHEERVVPAHIKGPADKPLVTSDRVHIWDTPPPPPPPQP
ncbi:hypothetical protein [Umezawaea sp. Da 62-37]|uniref:hypothetical protein n=1 Tax=Umezawaea sp. Da 62-37 TaxID=3075927 RepID=UPI0028F6E0F7|nr:hypothetical protein [Umezawaea sp. Da 62-37]WNV90255.1 hypothetical protein RM788_18800 [Umezawaea sp. Da 62-37]